MQGWWRCDLAANPPIHLVHWVRRDTRQPGKFCLAGVQYGGASAGFDCLLLRPRWGFVAVIAALYSIMALANFAVASKDFRKGYRASGFVWTAAGFAWLLAVFILVSGLGVIT